MVLAVDQPQASVYTDTSLLLSVILTSITELWNYVNTRISLNVAIF